MNDIQKLEQEIRELSEKLTQLRKNNPPTEVKNYVFRDLQGEVSLLDLFGKKDKLLVIHNMGQGCRYCTLWADGFNGFLPHLEDTLAVALVSKDPPETQRAFANSRQWRMRMFSHGGGEYAKDHTATTDGMNTPGIACYERKGDKIYKKNRASFGPGDQFCSHYNLLSLAGITPAEWTAQFHYWKRPEKLDDGGQGAR